MESKTTKIRDGPLDIWGGGGVLGKYQKKFAHRKNPEKKYRAKQTYWKKIEQEVGMIFKIVMQLF
jgi:hypothetical protein